MGAGRCAGPISAMPIRALFAAIACLIAMANSLVGGPVNNASAGGKDPALAALADGGVDIVIGYCTSARLRRWQMPELKVAAVPREIATGAEYAVAVLARSDPRTPDLGSSCCPRIGSGSSPITASCRGFACPRRSITSGLPQLRA